MLPSLHDLGKTPPDAPSQPPQRPQQPRPPRQRRSVEVADCAGELVYQVESQLGIGRERVHGSSAHFESKPERPIDEALRARKVLRPDDHAFFARAEVHPSVGDVVRALAAAATGEEDRRRECKRPRLEDRYESVEEGFVRVQKATPQYYAQELKTPATVVHMHEGAPGSVGELVRPEASTLFTSGVLWTNASPNWTWLRGPLVWPPERMTLATKKKHCMWIIRCRVDLPAGTQVVVDRHPIKLVKNSWFPRDACVLERTADGTARVAPFPDVLLLPGKFERTSVRHYREKLSRETLSQETHAWTLHLEEEESVVYQQAEEVRVDQDSEPARMLRSCHLFTDVALTLVESLRVSASPTPPSGSADSPRRSRASE